jgi:hypothetical protein
MEIKRCAACGQAFRPRSQVPLQGYCAEPACQRERRRRWQRAKRQSDPDYQDNQARAQRAWQKRNPDYWREYRREHPQYCDRNCAQQHERNARRCDPLIAKMDASAPVFPVPSGIYRIRPMPAIRIAKMDAWTVEITLLSALYDQSVDVGGPLQREDVMGA